jgi:hypothetical protein
MKMNSDHPKAAIYLFVLAIQIFGVIFFVWQQLPSFRRVLHNPGEQLAYDTYSDQLTVGVLSVMQILYWYRLLHIPIPYRRSNVILHHVFLFLGRLSFIFGSALFSVVVFRHLPALDQETDILLMLLHGIMLVGALFALFCASLEVERLGQAFGSDRG